jgi:hypothetical protein
MPRCDCGAITGRYIVHLEAPDGKPLQNPYTSCPSCHPAEFPAEQFAPSLDRLVSGPEAMPDKYWKDANDVYHPKDELVADTRAVINAEGPTGRMERLKRENRRITPMNPREIREADQIWRNRLNSL